MRERMNEEMIKQSRAMWENHDAKIREMVREYQIAHEKFSEAQLVSCIKQALEAGDFQRNVVVGTGAECVIYMPGRGMDELRRENEALRTKLQTIETILEHVEPW